MIAWAIPILVFLALVSLPWFAERRRHKIEVFRARAPGQFVKLSQGVTHYQWLGSKTGPVVVCVHGLTTPSPVWYAIAEGIGKMGYRVLVYDLYGRGFSDAPQGAQTGDFFARQLADLLQNQGLKTDVTLLGYSMGGSICTHFSAKYPEYVSRLILLASGGVWLRESRLTRWSRKLPHIGDWLNATLGVRAERHALHKQLGKMFDVKGIVEVQLAEYKSRGFVRSVLSSRRHMLSDIQEGAHRKIARAGIPVIGIWAEKDEVIPLKSLGTMTQWNRSVRQEVIPLADHAVGFTHSAEVVALLRDILSED